jgi:hypothetical protein
MTDLLKVKATVIDVAWVSADKNWRVRLHTSKGVVYDRYFYDAHPPSVNEEIEITI